MQPAAVLGQPLTLKNGSTLPNRIAKSALSETLGSASLRVTPRLITLYKHWAAGGSGLLVTGNVMIDRRHIGEPNNVVLEDDRDMDLLRQWARAGQSAGGQIWMQLNHPGKQAPVVINSAPIAPSALPLKPELKRFFAVPRAMTEDDIQDVILRFARAAALAQQAGFDGVQIHAAHGYLISQFLSPLHNKRDDQWGGDISNRMRLVLEVYRAMRAATGPGFNIGIKMNSADFQRGGFDEGDATTVAKALAAEGIDLIEISGGSYETPALVTGNTGKVKDSTRQREAYFLEFAETLRKEVTVPLMVTGGFRSASGMAEAVTSGACDMIGLGRPLCVEPDLPQRLLAGEDVHSIVRPIRTGVKAIDKLALMEVAWYERQIHRMSKGKNPRRQDQGFWSLLDVMLLVSYRGLFNRIGKLRA
ncbi:MAG TPA: NADH oxidase [Oceanospirillales bacterium]|nr:NADH oxidase [Oceanospirillaceae bacterium]HBS41111.1 NADH oxidase [Oceanospirillales bacterium]|tara:strand:- start:354 stop:1607 length:1254 start_codon:yes stop_codon:yes gene_type:complete